MSWPSLTTLRQPSKAACAAAMLCLILTMSACAADDPVFSGPQAEEKLPPFPVKTVSFDDNGQMKLAAEAVDWIAEANGKPTLLIVVHEVTRPAIGLARVLGSYGAKLEGAYVGMIVLTPDATETEAWMRRAAGTMKQLSMRIGISADGAEGPGAYGLNRNVQVTALVGKAGVVTANFALVQPSVQGDALKIAKALAAAAGAQPPTEQALLAAGRRMRDDQPAGRGVDLRSVLGPLLGKSLTPEQVAKEAANVEKLAGEKREVREAIGVAASRIVAADKLANYGTPAAQEHLKRWAEQWGPKAAPDSDRDAKNGTRQPEKPRGEESR